MRPGTGVEGRDYQREASLEFERLAELMKAARE